MDRSVKAEEGAAAAASLGLTAVSSRRSNDVGVGVPAPCPHFPRALRQPLLTGSGLKTHGRFRVRLGRRRRSRSAAAYGRLGAPSLPC